jgi:hypothetical protein
MNKIQEVNKNEDLRIEIGAEKDNSKMHSVRSGKSSNASSVMNYNSNKTPRLFEFPQGDHKKSNHTNNQ